MKKAVSLSVLVAACWSGLPVHAKLNPLDFVGYAKEISSTASSIMGSTTVTPAGALNDWRHVAWGAYHNVSYYRAQYVDRSAVLNSYTFRTVWIDLAGNVHTSSEPFDLDTVRRWNYRCDKSEGDMKTINNEVEDFSLAVWASAVRQTGLFPPSPPYPVWAGSDAVDLPSTCSGTEFVPRTVAVISGTKVYATGTYVFRFWRVGSSYSWPPELWVGAWTDYAR